MKKVFFILKIPPPIHGSTLMNQKVMKSNLLQTYFNCYYFPVSISNDVSDIGKISWEKILKVLKSYISLIFSLRKNNPDLVYFSLSPSGTAFMKDFLFFLIISCFKTKIVFHLHGKGISDQGKKSQLFHRLYRYLFQKNHAICLSSELTEDIKMYVENPYIIPNGIEKLNFNELKRQPKNYKDYQIVYLSNFIKSKGILDLIQALGIVKRRGNHFSLSLIGKAGDVSLNELKEYLRTCQLETMVNHIGPLYNNAKFEELLKSDLLVFPTYYKKEAFPLVIIEAMQCGLPIISTYHAGIPSLVDEGITGFLIKERNNIELADKIEYLIKNPHESKRMGLAGKQKFDLHFTIGIFEHNLVKVFKDILNN